MIENARDIFGTDLSPDNEELLDLLGIMTPDQIGRLVTDRRPDRGVNRAAGAREIAAAEDAMQWPIRYIVDDGERRALALWIFCDLTNAPFGRLSPKIAGSRGTAYRRLDKALSRIVAGLQSDGVAPI